MCHRHDSHMCEASPHSCAPHSSIPVPWVLSRINVYVLRQVSVTPRCASALCLRSLSLSFCPSASPNTTLSSGCAPATAFRDPATLATLAHAFPLALPLPAKPGRVAPLLLTTLHRFPLLGALAHRIGKPQRRLCRWDQMGCADGIRWHQMASDGIRRDQLDQLGSVGINWDQLGSIGIRWDRNWANRRHWWVILQLWQLAHAEAAEGVVGRCEQQV